MRSGSHLLKLFFACLVSLSLASGAVWAAGPKVTRMSASRIKKDLSGKNVVKVIVRKRGGGPTWYPSEGRTLWEQTVEIHYRTEFKGVTKVSRGDVEYVWTGKGWKYNRVRSGGISYAGLKNPSAKDFAAALAIAGQESVLSLGTLKSATKIHSVKISKKAKWHWADPKTVIFRATVIFDTKSGLDLAKVEQDFKVTMRRDSMKGGFADYCKKNPSCITGSSPEQRKVLSKTKVGGKRLDAMKSLHTVARERYIKPLYASLNPPEKWTDLKQFARYAYKALYTGDERTWEAFYYNNGGYSDEVGKAGKIFIENKDAFRSQFCPELVITKKWGRKGDDETFIFSDKGGKSKCGINVWDFNGYRIKKTWCEFAVGDEAATIAAIPAAKGCVEKLAADKVYNVLGLKVGDPVMSKWGGKGKEFPGKVRELKEKTIWIAYDDGSNEEVGYGGVRRKDGKTTAAPKAKTATKAATTKAPAAKAPAADAPHPSGLKVGDKIISKWHGTGNEYPGKVGKLKGERVFVHYDDGSKEWVPIKAVRKK
ncbi:MAG: hypothetical protein JRF33_23090 [Deltaproteobacteria bacterium]|nr:hypothetical protein [Deltaproteobacteria bacterium]